MQSHHFMGHDLDLLESYVHDCIQQLPKLPGAADTTAIGASSTQIPTRCATYHTVCANMLKEVMALLTLFSPRLCRLVAQIWDLASLNVFVLLQLSNVALQDAHRLREQLAFTERFHAEDMRRQASAVQRYEDELAQQRLSDQSLRAELQKVRQRANRLAVENGQLHLVVSRVLDAQAAMEATRFDHANPAEQTLAQQPDGPSFCEDVAAVGDAEERELFGIDTIDEDALSRVETVHPIESYGTDFEQLFQALFEGEERSVRVLNDMDRFINSTAVALLWRYGSTEEEHRLMHKMLSASTVGTQTDGTTTEKAVLSSRSGGQWESDSEYDGSDDEGGNSRATSLQRTQELNGHEDGSTQQRQKIAKHEVVAVIKHQVIPSTLRAQLDSRPRVHRVLEKKQLNRILLRLYLEKLECDARLLRQRFRVPSASQARRTGANSSNTPLSIGAVRTPLHRFMKEFFLKRYEVPALADFHMMEVVKSCLYYHEQLDAVLRRGAMFASTALVGCLPGMPENILQHMQLHQQHALNEHPLKELFQQQQQFVSSDVRVALFSRLCELVPFAAYTPSAASTSLATVAGGNMSACLLNAVVDVLGDVLELDSAVLSLAEVEVVPSEASWGFPRALALELLARHLTFIDQATLEDTRARIAQLSPVVRPGDLSSGDATSTDCIAVDVFLALFATSWFTYDQHLGAKLRESFHHQLLLTSPFAKRQMAGADAARKGAYSEASGNGLEQSNSVDAAPVINRLNSRRSTTILPAVLTGGMTAASTTTSPLEILAQAWRTLENESLSSLDMEELESAFRSLLEAKQLDAKHRYPASVKKGAPGPSHSTSTSGLSLGGVTEKEFVFHSLQVLRRRRNNYGLRTNGKRPHSFGQSAGSSKIYGGVEADDLLVPLETLKPGLGSDSLTYVGT